MPEFSNTVAAYNADRKDALAQRRQVYGHVAILAGFLALIFGLGAIALLRSLHMDLAITVIVTCAMGVIPLYKMVRDWINRPARELQCNMRQIVFPSIFHEIEDLRFRSQAEGFVNEVPDALRPYWKLSDYGHRGPKLRYHWGDMVEGWYDGHPIAISELKATQRVRRGKHYRTETLFEGLTMKFGLARPVPSISISRVEGKIAAVLNYLAWRAGSDSKTRPLELDRDVECSDPAFAAAVFSEEGLRRFCMLQSTHARGDMRFAARQSTAYLMIDTTKNHFELPPIDRPLDEIADVRRLRGEMSGLLELISDLREMVEIDPPQASRPVMVPEAARRA